MRWILYVAILASLFAAPLERADVAKLLPIRAVCIYIEDGDVVLETDTENLGRGASVAEALDDLKRTTPAIVYLDTAEYLLVSPNAEDCIGQLRNVLKPSVKVCVCDASGRVLYTVKYLDAHGNLPKLGDLKM